MPKGIYIRTEEIRKKVSIQFKKLWQNPKFRKNMSLIKLGNKNALGYKHLEETKRKISLALKGKNFTKEHKRNISLKLKGRKLSEETKIKMSLAKKGKIAEKSNNWRGNKVGYSGVHQWISKNKLKPELCEECKKIKKLSLSNISGKYKRDNNDFRWLCYSCHKKFDLKRKEINRDIQGRYCQKE